MLIIRLLRYIQGYYFIEASGGFPERFINLCTKNRIPVWDIRHVSGTLTFFCSAAYLDMLTDAAEKAGMELHTLNETGIKVFMKKHKKRRGLLVSATVCILVTAFLSQFVWSVSVEGNDFYSNEEIYEAFESRGVKIGSLKSRIDTRSVSEAVSSELENVSWAKVNIRGCFAVIEIKEVVRKPEIFDRTRPVNIIASDDGLIMRNEVEVGSPAVKSGIAVTRGDLLVSSVITNPDGSETLVHSKALVTAEVKKKITRNISSDVFSQSSRTEKNELFFFGLEIPKIKNKQDYFESRQYLDNAGRLLPAGIFHYRKAVYDNPFSLDEQAAVLLALHRFNGEAAEYCLSAERILDTSVKLDSNSVTGVFTVEKNIGVEQEILTE
jgi:sporulation protein YqfD